MSFLLCFFFEPVDLQFFWGGNANSWPVRGSNYGPPVPDAPTLPTLRPAKILWRTPNVRLSITAPLVCTTTTTTVPALARHVQPFFPRSLQAHADVSRRWRASSPPSTSRHRHRAPRQSFMFLPNYVCSYTITTLWGLRVSTPPRWGKPLSALAA